MGIGAKIKSVLGGGGNDSVDKIDTSAAKGVTSTGTTGTGAASGAPANTAVANNSTTGTSASGATTGGRSIEELGSNMGGIAPPSVAAGRTVAAESATGGDNHDSEWHKARELTRAAEVKEEEAKAAASEAKQHLTGIDSAQRAADSHFAEQQALLAEANRQKGVVGDASTVEGNLAQARAVADQKAAAAAEAAKAADLEKKRLAGLEKDYQGAIAPVQKYQTNIAQIDEAMAGLGPEREEYERRRKEQWDKYEDSERIMNISYEKERQANEEYRRMSQLAAEHERALNDARARLKDMEGRLGPVRDDVTVAEKHHKEQHEKIEELDRHIIDRRQAYSDLTNKRNTAQQALADTQAQAESKAAEARAARERAEAAMASAQPLAADHNAARQQASALEAELEGLRGKQKEAENAYNSLMADAATHGDQAQQATEAARARAADYGALKEEAQQAHLTANEHWAHAKEIGNAEHGRAATVLEKLEQKLGLEAAVKQV